jgi:hypothetical protein
MRALADGVGRSLGAKSYRSAEVERRREEWVPWSIEHFVDSAEPLDENVSRALARVDRAGGTSGGQENARRNLAP